MDYPPSGSDAAAVVNSFDPDPVCADVLAVADAAGADRFAWYGYSRGGLVGLQLAARTNKRDGRWLIQFRTLTVFTD